jgi:hypothetical protein
VEDDGPQAVNGQTQIAPQAIAHQILGQIAVLTAQTRVLGRVREVAWPKMSRSQRSQND